MTTKEDLQKLAIEILNDEKNGLRHSELVEKIDEKFPNVPEGTIFGAIWTLIADHPAEVYKPSRGLYRHTRYQESSYQGDGPSQAEAGRSPSQGIESDEKVLYEPFANYLVKELEECTKAVPLGGNRLGGKWGTPDVIGILRPRESDIYKPPTEVISAEVKRDASQLIVAFGQACAYKLFSHRSYLVVPESSGDDIDRLDSLCQIFGIGFVTFATSDGGPSRFNVKLRAARHEPDAFYVNKILKEVEADLFH